MADRTVIGFDPAVRNFGYAVVRKGKVLDTGVLRDALTSLGNGFQAQADVYRKHVMELRRLKPDLLVIERFQTRHRLTMAQGECVNIMIGMAAGYMQDVPIRLVIPGAWKKKVPALKEMYNAGRKRVREIARGRGLQTPQSKALQQMVPHCVDAACLAILYGGMEMRPDLSRRLARVLMDESVE